MRKIVFSLFATCLLLNANAQKWRDFTKADTLRGTLTPERTWWNVLHYDITVKPDYTEKTTVGNNIITYRVTADNSSKAMQIDLQPPLTIDSVILDNKTSLETSHDGTNVWLIKTPAQKKSSTHTLQVYFSGKPHEAIRAPWDGGWTFTKDTLGHPWMTVTCQAKGASIWYPCKDHQSDEPDDGASLTMIVPDTLVAVANGRLQSKKANNDGTVAYKWAVVNPINNYDIIPYIGKYVNFSEVYKGLKGNLDVNYWVLDYNLDKAKAYMPKEVHNMLNAFEYWFGPYPFYEDGYKLIDASHTGMEHQSAVAYGNWYKPGYRGRDGSGTGIGMKWDFIIIHESGHEWFGNNITSNDLADMWIHESFTNYSETLFVDYIYGKDDANAYNAGTRKGIRNDRPVIPQYNVNAEGSGDMYPKGGNMLHAIRHSIDNDSLFRNILRGLNKTFYHKTVDAKDIFAYMSRQAGFDYTPVFKQYLTTTQIPTLEWYFSEDNSKVFYRYTNCIKGFNLPVALRNNEASIKIYPSEEWKSSAVNAKQQSLFDNDGIKKMYYLEVMKTVRQ